MLYVRFPGNLSTFLDPMTKVSFPLISSFPVYSPLPTTLFLPDSMSMAILDSTYEIHKICLSCVWFI